MNELANTPARTSALAIMADRLQVDPAKLHTTLKNTVFKAASDDEMLALCIVANEYKLNPLTKQIYAFPAKGGGIVPVVSVDGWLHIANAHPQMDGVRFESHHEDGHLVAMTCRIFRKDRKHPIEVTEYLEECIRPTEPWKMKHRMLRHKAFMQCCRVAFGFAGIVDEDEAGATPGMRDVTPPEPAAREQDINPFEDSAPTGRTQPDAHAETPPTLDAEQVDEVSKAAATSSEKGELL